VGWHIIVPHNCTSLGDWNTEAVEMTVEYGSCRNDIISALMFVEIMLKNKVVAAVVFCFFM